MSFCCFLWGVFFIGFYFYNIGVFGNLGDNGGVVLFQDGNMLVVVMQEGGYCIQFVGKYFNGYVFKYVLLGWFSWIVNNRGFVGDDWNSFDVMCGFSGSLFLVGQSVYIE